MAAITACWLPGCFSSQLAAGNSSWDVRGPQGKKRSEKEADPRRSEWAVGWDQGHGASGVLLVFCTSPLPRCSATFFHLAGCAVLPRMPACLETPLIQNVIGTIERPCMGPSFRPSFVPLFLGILGRFGDQTGQVCGWTGTSTRYEVLSGGSPTARASKQPQLAAISVVSHSSAFRASSQRHLNPEPAQPRR